jgi:tetratricopeptide (TPR) repeat protein
MNPKKILLAFFFATGFCSRGQNLDSLSAEILQITLKDSAKIKTIIRFAEMHEVKDVRIWENLLQKSKSLGLDNYQLDLQYNLSYCYTELGLFEKSLPIFLEISKEEEKRNYSEGLIQTYNEIAQIFRHEKDTGNALKYFRKSLRLAEKNTDHKNIAMACHNIASVYVDADDTSRAYFYGRIANEHISKVDYPRGKAYILQNLGILLYRQKKYDEAIRLFNECATIRQLIDDRSGLSLTYTNLGDCYFEKKENPKAKNFFEKAFKIADSLGFIENIKRSALSMIPFFEATGDYKSAVKYYDILYKTDQKISGKSQQDASLKKLLQYEYEKKSFADSLRTAEEKKLADATLRHEKTVRYALFGGISVLIIFGAFTYNRFRLARKQKRIIEETNREVVKQKQVIEGKQKEILDSIYYARRIQRSLVTSERYIEKALRELTANKGK